MIALSTDEFSMGKDKRSFYDYETRKEMLEAILECGFVISEDFWEQKVDDVKRYGIDVVVPGNKR